jgi:hypothetical protein
VPKWEEYPHTPGVFVRAANKGIAGYGTWKSVRKMGGGAAATEARRHREELKRAPGKGKKKAFALKEVPRVFCKCCN